LAATVVKYRRVGFQMREFAADLYGVFAL